MSDSKVVFVCHDVGGPGGMERHAQRLIECLLDSGREVTVVARTCQMPARAGLHFCRIRTPSRPFTLAYPLFFAVASRVLARRGAGVLHTTGAIVANRADLATVHYCHHAAAQEEGARRGRDGARLHRLNAALAAGMARAAERYCYRPSRTRALCAVSGGVADELRRHFPSMAPAILSIPNGVDLAVFGPDPEARRAVRVELGLADDAQVALFAGGDWDRKGLTFAVSALAHAPEWHLVVAGGGDHEPILALARGGGSDARLRLLGQVSGMARLYAAVDAFVLPTRYEAFPLVSLEAAAGGVPLLITRVNGVEELLRDGETGWFIERDPEDIGRRLRELARDRERARAMGAAARAAVEAYSWEAMAARYGSLYDRLAPPSLPLNAFPSPG